MTLARMKEHARATAEADALAGYRKLPADALYQLSSVYAISAAAVATDAKLFEQYAARGVNLLGRAVAQGFKDVEKVQKDPELEALRSRPDFTALLTRLLNNASWTVVAKPGADAAAYRQALLQAEEASRLAPNDHTFLNTLGVAQYRLEKYREAVETLTHSDQLHAARNGGSVPADLAFLAMAQGRLGQSAKAQRLLQPPARNDAESAVGQGPGGTSLPTRGRGAAPATGQSLTALFLDVALGTCLPFPTWLRNRAPQLGAVSIHSRTVTSAFASAARSVVCGSSMGWRGCRRWAAQDGQRDGEHRVETVSSTWLHEEREGTRMKTQFLPGLVGGSFPILR